MYKTITVKAYMYGTDNITCKKVGYCQTKNKFVVGFREHSSSS